jgi:hypothetical protein
VSITLHWGIRLKQTKHKKKLKTKNEKLQNLEKLSEYLRTNNISETEAIERLQVQSFDPAKDFYSTLVSASKQLMSKVRDELLDLDDPYQKGLFQLLQAGDKINKSLKLAKLEAYPEDNNVEEEGGFLDRVSHRR